MENLKLPEKYRRTGLYVYCYKCHRYSNIKDGYLKKTPDCNHPPDRQVYKIKVHVPGTKKMCRTLALDTKDIKEVEQKRLEFINLLEQNKYSKSIVVTPAVPIAERYLLTYQMKRYLDYITNGGFHDFERPKELTKQTINDYKRYFKYFLQSIAGVVDIHTIRVDEILVEHIDLFHKYLKAKTSSIKTYNNIMSSLRTFYNHVIKYEELNIRNIFDKVPVESVHYDPLSFTWTEFKRVLAATTPKNGYDPEEKRNRYRDWLPTAFKLGLFTGLRLNELIRLEYRDIIKGEDGIYHLQAINVKANKLIGNGSNERIIRRAVIPELKKVLDEECDFDALEGEEDYIIAPEESRANVKDLITKGFTHFKRKAGIDERKCFKNLRTTYLSRHHAEYGDSKLTATTSDHSNPEIMLKHYATQMDAIRRTKDFRVFPEAEESDSQGS